MAGLKPQTEFFVVVEDDESLENVKIGVESLNELLKRQNPDIRLKLVGEPFISPTDKQRTQMIDVQNLGINSTEARVIVSISGYTINFLSPYIAGSFTNQPIVVAVTSETQVP